MPDRKPLYRLSQDGETVECASTPPQTSPVPTEAECASCEGSGRDTDEADAPCWVCRGTGVSR